MQQASPKVGRLQQKRSEMHQASPKVGRLQRFGGGGRERDRQGKAKRPLRNPERPLHSVFEDPELSVLGELDILLGAGGELGVGGADLC